MLNSTIRINWLFAIMAACFVLITAQLYFIQVIRHDLYTGKSHSNRTRHIRDRAQRGRITDRLGRQLATTKPSFSLYITPEDFERKNRNNVYRLLGLILDLSPETIKEKYQAVRTASYRPRKIVGNLTYKQVVRIETNRYDLTGVSIKAENIRAYPQGETLCHLIGYVGEISRKQLNMSEYVDYRVSDIIGKTGIEKTYENMLNGQDGYRWVEVDATGRQGRTLRYPTPELASPGMELRLTIDLDLQIACEKFLQSWKGCIIVLDPGNGDILAMVSNPGFDPNWFASGMSKIQWRSIDENPDNPLLNRAIQFQEPPGSVFKVVTSMAGLISGHLTPETSFFCNGTFVYSKHIYHCWNVFGHGSVDLPHAIEGSCNVFFYQAGIKTGIDLISDTAHKFGLGQLTGISLPNEKAGFIPDRKWKEETHDEPWWPGETISVSIGQGGVTTTPLQLACLMAMTANRGVIYRPRLIQAIVGHTSRESNEVKPEIIHVLEAPDQYWDQIMNGLALVVKGRNGTAKKMHMREMTAAGKTGTAQVISSKTLKNMGYGPKNQAPQKYWDHNWFVGFAPVENPKIVVVVCIENGGKKGTRKKITISKNVFLKWYELNHDGYIGPMQQVISND
ncbi:penicillin-binding protein 2 [bacterium]|nr:penicillin-binding protein 2 [bacterium]